MTRLIVVFCFAIAALITNPVNAQFSDDFDSYTNGQDLHNVNGWKGWGADPFAAALVSDAQSSSDPHSIAIGGPSDLVNELGNPTSGCWEMTIQQYIPADLTGNTFFIILSRYADTGPFGHNQWSVELLFTGATGMLTDDFDGTLAPVPILFDQWVQIKMVIDLDNDTLDQYYNGVLLNSRGWMRTGVPEIGCVDLYSQAASEIYYDNFVLQNCPPPGPILATTVTVTEGDFVFGGLPELAASDNTDYTLRRRNADLQSRTEFELMSTSPTASPATFEFTLEGSVFGRGNVVQTIELFDYVAAAWELVDTSDANRAPAPDSVVTATPTGDLSRFVDAGTMSIEARIRYKSDANRQKFASNTDQVFWVIN